MNKKQIIFLPTITLFQVSTRFQVSPSLEITVDRVFLYGTPLGRASLFRISPLRIFLELSRWKRRDDSYEIERRCRTRTRTIGEEREREGELPRVPCLDNLTVSREYNGRISENVTRNAFGKLAAGRLWIVVVAAARPNSSIARTDMRAPLYSTIYPILYIPREILLDSFRLFECFSITFYHSAISGRSNELSNVYFFETQCRIFFSRTSLLLAFLFRFERNYPTFRYFFETQWNIFKFYFFTFRLFILI